MELKDMLKAEIKRSAKFSENHYGLMTGEGFAEMCDEMLQSTSVCKVMIAAVLGCVAGIKKFQEYVGEHGGPENKEELTALVKSQVRGSLRPFLEIFYWGMQIGAKRKQEEMEALSSIEKDLGKINIDNRVGDVKMTDEDRKAIDDLLAEAKECPLCHKEIGPKDVLEMVGGPHVLCADPTLSKHSRLDRSMAGGGRQMGYVDDNGKERWL
jgi:hypothetical protein